MKVTVENIKEVIVEADVVVDVNDIKCDLPLIEQGLDSLDLVNIYFLLEEKFNVKIPDEDLDKVATIDAIVEYINNKLD